MIVWFVVFLALAPSFILFVYVAKVKRSVWFTFGLGCLGWVVAFYARLPILTGISRVAELNILIIFALYALFAGVFEESLRYGLIRKVEKIRIDWKHVLSFGLGWGFIEAVLVYAVNILATVYVLGMKIAFLDMLAGAVERNFTVIFHVAMTFIVCWAVKAKKLELFIVAILIHTIVDFTVVVLYHIIKLPLWYVETLIFGIAILTLMFAWILKKRLPTKF